MSVYTVEVDVALARPPRADDTVWFRIEAPTGTAAELLACQWVFGHRGVVMPVRSTIIDWEAGAP